MSNVETTARQWQRVKAILADALELESPKERAAFLENSCHGDTTLMREVEALMAQPTRKLDELADNTPVSLERTAPDQPIGRRIGAYEITREIGRGGMGAVYLAKRADGQFDKKVAIKVLKRGTDTDEILRRFHAERRILAQLDHSNIARLVDAGTTKDGLPYFVMEYVSGVSITQYVRDKQLPIAGRLQLFLKLCETVHFAHKHRVVHRDLKPGNILVTGDGEPKLLDFGIAKLLAPNGETIELTLTTERRFTPVCASPEQARGEPVTPASDVYALGALLYELLTDRPPHRFSTPHPSQAEVAQVIGEQEPSRPSFNHYDNRIRRQLRGDLDKIVLMALRKEPARRYESAAALAEDIRRHIDGSPIRAQPNTLVYVFRRFVARQKYRIAALVMLATLGIALTVVLFNYGAELKRHHSLPNSESSLDTADKSIAVLPFENLSDDKGNSFFADGVQDQILTDLTKLKDIKVISRTSVAQYKNVSARNLPEIARQLGVVHVLEGTVQRAGNRIRISAQLIDARTDSHLWAENYERDLADVFAIQSEIAKTIAEQLQAKISPNEKRALEQKPTADLVAYDLYLRANALRHEISTSKDWEADTRRAVDLLDQAIARDHDFTLAYCMLCKLNFTLYAWVDKTPARLALVENAVNNAIRIAPESGETYLVRGRWYMHEMDWERGLDAVMRAAKLLPGNVDVLTDAADLESRLGRWTEATRDLERAKDLDPANPNIPNGLTALYASLHEYSRSDQIADAAIVRFPSGPGYFQAAKITNAIDRGDVTAAKMALAAIAPGWDPSGLTSELRVAVAVADRNFTQAAHLIATTPKEKLIEFSAVDLGFFEALVARKQGDNVKARAVLISMREQAEAHLRDLPNDIPLLSRVARIDAYLGRSEDAFREIARAAQLARDAVGRPGVMTVYAEVYLCAGQRDKALQLLSELAKRANGPSYGDLLGPRWDSLRTDPRFQALLTEATRPVKI